MNDCKTIPVHEDETGSVDCDGKSQSCHLVSHAAIQVEIKSSSGDEMPPTVSGIPDVAVMNCNASSANVSHPHPRECDEALHVPFLIIFLLFELRNDECNCVSLQ